MKTTTLQHQRRRKALLALPLPVICFTTLLFYVLGGGAAQAAGGKTSSTGLNKQLPNAQLKSKQPLNKLAYYDQASADSAKAKQLRLTDPYAGFTADSVSGTNPSDALAFSPHQSGLTTSGSPQANAQKISERLNALQQIINKPEKPFKPEKYPTTFADHPAAPAHAAAEDPALKQMNGLLERILDIQHPERVQQRSAESNPPIAEEFKAIPALVEGTQKIVQGTVIKLRLLDSVRLKDQLFAKGTLIYGSGDLYNQRYKVNIKLIRQGNSIIPVDLTVYDKTDGLEGICVPEAVTGDAVKDGAINGIQNMDLMSFDPSVTAQLTTAGINTAKGLFSKKVKRVKGKIKGGHQLLLRINKP